MGTTYIVSGDDKRWYEGDLAGARQAMEQAVKEDDTDVYLVEHTTGDGGDSYELLDEYVSSARLKGAIRSLAAEWRRWNAGRRLSDDEHQQWTSTLGKLAELADSTGELSKELKDNGVL